MGSCVCGLFCFGVGWGFGGCFVLFGEKKCERANCGVSVVSDAGDSLVSITFTIEIAGIRAKA